MNVVMALNSSFANLSWAAPLYSCPLTYIVEVVNNVSGLVVHLENTTSTDLNIITLMVGEIYSFKVASVDVAERMSNWSQSVLLAMQGKFCFCLCIITKCSWAMCAIFTENTCAAPGEVEIIAVSQQKVMQWKYITAEWKVL